LALLATAMLLAGADKVTAGSMHLAPIWPSMGDCYELNRANEVNVVVPAREALLACVRNRVTGRGKTSTCGPGNGHVVWDQCMPESRAHCTAVDGKREQYNLCVERARQRSKRDTDEAAAQRRIEQDEDLTMYLAAYENAERVIADTAQILTNPKEFFKRTMPVVATEYFPSIMSDTFGPNGEIRDGLSQRVDEYYQIALPAAKMALRLVTRDPFIRFIQKKALDELRRRTSDVFAEFDAAARDMRALTSKIADSAARASSFRPAPPSLYRHGRSRPSAKR
jgi:hypothetical protein